MSLRCWDIWQTISNCHTSVRVETGGKKCKTMHIDIMDLLPEVIAITPGRVLCKITQIPVWNNSAGKKYIL